MPYPTTLQENYSTNASAYTQFATLPLGTLEAQLFTLCITNCTGFKVLDLGGGTGLRARDALAAGASAVDVVDISPEMMQQGQMYEASIGRSAIKWYEGDASESLDHLGLGEYDLVIANGVFDHAESAAKLEKMWENAAKYLKPGGRVVANRNNPYSRAARDGKYGVLFGEFRRFEGGVKFRYKMLTDPALEFESVALDVYCGGSLEICGKFFEGFENVDWRETEAVKSDWGLWKEYLEDPILYIFTARKKAT